MHPGRPDDLATLVRELRFTYYQTSKAAKDSGLFINQMSEAYGLLTDLYYDGPKTMPQLLSNRVFSRQYLHRMVKALEEEGLVQWGENPEHKRSKFVELTQEGKSFFEEKRGMIMDSLIPSTECLNTEQITNAIESLIMLRDGFKQVSRKLEKD